MEHFNFIVKDENKKAFNLFFWFLFFLHFSIAAYVAIKNYSEAGTLLQLRFVIVYAVITILFYLLKKTKFSFSIDNPGLWVLYVGFWFTYQAYLPMVLIAVVVLLVKYLQTKKNEVIVSSDMITMKGVVATKKIPWQDIDNLILKDGLLSIDLKSNKLFQFDIVTNDISEIQFNQFCLKQLSGK